MRHMGEEEEEDRLRTDAGKAKWDAVVIHRDG